MTNVLADDTIDLQDQIERALNIAIHENQYLEMLSWDPETIAKDLVEYDEGFSTYQPDQLVPYVRAYLADQPDHNK